MAAPHNIETAGLDSLSFWAFAEGQFTHEPDRITIEEVVTPDSFSKSPDARLGIPEIKIPYVDLFEDMGIKRADHPHALLPTEEVAKRIPNRNLIGFIKTLPYYGLNGRATHDIRRLIIARDLSGRGNMGIMRVWDGLLDFTTNEGWTLPDNDRTPIRVSHMERDRTAKNRPYLHFGSASRELKMSMGADYERLFEVIEQIGELVTPSQVVTELQPLFGGGAVDMAGKMQYESKK